jgi:hypothetical protein
MIGTGALLVYAAIKGTSPLEELRALLTGKRPEPLGTQPRGEPIITVGPGVAAPSAVPGGKGQAQTTGREKPHVAQEMRTISDRWGIRVLGWGLRPTNPGSDHPRGLALDAMVGGDARRDAQARNIGNAIASEYQANAQAKLVKYIIWNGRIWNPSRNNNWRPYLGFGGHFDHVHISFYDLGTVPRGRIQ